MIDKSRGDEDVKTVLFLCTGNYYRSRFAEELFNHKAAARGLPWEADSAGLHPNPHNQGPISALVLDRLETLDIQPQHANRSPRPAESFDLAGAGLVIAMSRKEHQGLMKNIFPEFAPKTLFWDVADVAEMHPTEALDAMEKKVDDLISELQNGCAGLAGNG